MVYFYEKGRWRGFVLADVGPIYLLSLSIRNWKRRNLEIDRTKECLVRKQRSQRRRKERHSDPTNNDRSMKIKKKSQWLIFRCKIYLAVPEKTLGSSEERGMLEGRYSRGQFECSHWKRVRYSELRICEHDQSPPSCTWRSPGNPGYGKNGSHFVGQKIIGCHGCFMWLL